MQNSCPRGKSSPEMPIQIDDGVRKRKRRARQKKDRRAKLTEDGTGGGRNGQRAERREASQMECGQRAGAEAADSEPSGKVGGRDGRRAGRREASQMECGQKAGAGAGAGAADREPSGKVGGRNRRRTGESEGGRVGGREGWRTRWAEGGTARSSANGERDRRMVSSADREPEPLSERRDCKQDARRCYRSTRNH